MGVERILTLETEGRQRPEGLVRPERLGELFDAQHARLYRLARRLSGDPEEARDLVQETFLRAARKLTPLPGVGPAAEAWLVRVLVNLCRDRARRQRVRDRAASDPILRERPGVNLESAAVARATVETALRRLSPRRRAVVVLHELEERTVPEISRLLGIARATVRWHLAAGKRDLKVILLGERGASRDTEGRR